MRFTGTVLACGAVNSLELTISGNSTSLDSGVCSGDKSSDILMSLDMSESDICDTTSDFTEKAGIVSVTVSDEHISNDFQLMLQSHAYPIIIQYNSNQQL